jgi:hypothetical protein
MGAELWVPKQVDCAYSEIGVLHRVPKRLQLSFSVFDAEMGGYRKNGRFILQRKN